jgi:hypothetical protein
MYQDTSKTTKWQVASFLGQIADLATFIHYYHNLPFEEQISKKPRAIEQLFTYDVAYVSKSLQFSLLL